MFTNKSNVEHRVILHIFPKTSILDVWRGSECASVLLSSEIIGKVLKVNILLEVVCYN